MHEKDLADILGVNINTLKETRRNTLYEGVDWIMEPYKRTGRVVYTETGIENATRLLAFPADMEVLDESIVTVTGVPKNTRVVKVQDFKGSGSLCAVPPGVVIVVGMELPIRLINGVGSVRYALDMSRAKSMGILKRSRKKV